MRLVFVLSFWKGAFKSLGISPIIQVSLLFKMDRPPDHMGVYTNEVTPDGHVVSLRMGDDLARTATHVIRGLGALSYTTVAGPPGRRWGLEMAFIHVVDDSINAANRMTPQ